MTRIPKRLARRIDRLAGRAHAFHRFAHHPLCGAYRGEVLVFGRTRICKGCAFMALGALAGIPLGCLLPALPSGMLALVAALACAWVWAVFAASWPRRLGKGGTRLIPALLGVCLAIQGFRRGGAGGLMLAAGIGIGLAIALRAYRRRGPWRGPCAQCPERELMPCPGFRPQLRRERAFRRLVGRVLSGDGRPESVVD